MKPLEPTAGIVSFCAVLLTLVCSVRADVNDTTGWYRYQGGKDNTPGVIGMNDWLDAPAGKHGWVRQKGGGFGFDNGQAIKFWGTNLQYSDCMPPKESAAGIADRFAKYGVNAVRQHKIMEPGWAGFGHPDDSLKFDSGKLDRFDFFNAQLRRRGIYYGISWVFGHKLRDADVARLDFPGDFPDAKSRQTNRVLVFIAPDVQNLRLEMLKNLLTHKNPYTGLRYADDPAVNFVELQNEDSIFFYTFSGLDKLDAHPRYKRRFIGRWNDWLRKKYGSHEKLLAAWGKRAMNSLSEKNEDLAKGNVMLTGNPWLFSPPGLTQAKEMGRTRRMLDNAEFLWHVQREFYDKFAKAMSEVGYEGPLVGSCWTTPSGLPLYYNLHTDYEVGFIDRHNYFGGVIGGYRAHTGKMHNTSMLARPGSGLLSSGFLQVLDRPFALSEWNSYYPNQWTLEAVSLIATYGMGLQGWDASYQFTSHAKANMLGRMAGSQKFVVDRIDQMGLYPTFARMIHRGDVRQGREVGVRRVAIDRLADGGPEWMSRERSENDGDVKEMAAGYDAAAMAVGRVGVEFVEKPARSTLPDLSKHTKGETVVSTTGQLAWTVKDKQGHVTVNTPGTQAAFGFLPSQPIRLGDATITPETGFCGVYLTSLDRKAPLVRTARILLTAMARVRDTGMVFSQDMTELKDMGKPPLLLEPVQAAIDLPGRTISRVELLDHDGLPTGRTLPIRQGRIDLDTGRDKTPYYLIVLE